MATDVPNQLKAYQSSILQLGLPSDCRRYIHQVVSICIACLLRDVFAALVMLAVVAAMPSRQNGNHHGLGWLVVLRLLAAYRHSRTPKFPGASTRHGLKNKLRPIQPS